MRPHLLPRSNPCKPPNLTKPLLLLLATLTCTTRLVDSVASVSVTLHSFSNPENKLKDGNYCFPDQSPCSMKFAFMFKEPIKYNFVTNLEAASDIQYKTGPDAITDTTGKDIPNPFPENTTTTNAIRLLSFTIAAFHYDGSGSKHDVAKFKFNHFATFGTENYGFTDGFSEFNLTTNINCAPDYYKDCSVHCVDTPTSTCNQTDGAKICKHGWSGANCDIELVLPCNPNVSVLNGDYTPQQDSYSENDQVTVTCDPGYRPPSSTITCQKNGTWNNPWPICREIRCVKIPAPSNGDVSPVSVIHTTSPIGCTVTFTCLPGSTLNGTETLSCQSDGTWNGSAPYCDVNLCPDIRNTVPDKNAMGWYLANPPARHPGNVFKHTCTAGYVRRGPEERQCLNNGTWTGDVFTCHKKCKKFESFTNGKVSYSSEVPSEDTNVMFYCNPGNSLKGAETAVCLANGTWNLKETPKCVPTCTLDDILLPGNVTITPSTYQTDSLEVGYTLTFSCSGPYLSYLSTSPYMTCLDTGHWNSTVPSCMLFVPDIDDTLHSLLISGLSILSGVFAVFVVIVLILVYINKRMRTNSKTVKDNILDSTSRNSVQLHHIAVLPGAQNISSQSQRFKSTAGPRNTNSRNYVTGIRNHAYVEDF